MLSVSSAAQESVASLFESADQMGLMIVGGSDTGPTPRVALYVTGEDRTAHLTIADKESEPQVILMVREDGSTTLVGLGDDEGEG
jgi:hypothetical protein